MSPSFQVSNLQKREHFRFGDKLTPQKLNGIYEYTDARLDLLTRVLVGGKGGIVPHFLGELRVEPFTGQAREGVSHDLRLIVNSGAVVSQSGQILILDERVIIDFNDFALTESPQIFNLILKRGSILERSERVPSDSESGSGFDVHRFQTYLEVTLDAPQYAECMIARVCLSNATTKLEFGASERFPDEGVISELCIDRISALGGGVFGKEKKLQLRRLLMDLDRDLFKLGRYVQTKMESERVFTLIDLLMAEVLSPTVVREKIEYLLEKLLSHLSSRIEGVRNYLPNVDGINEAINQALLSLLVEPRLGEDKIDAMIHCLGDFSYVIRGSVLTENIDGQRLALLGEDLQVRARSMFTGEHIHSFGRTPFERMYRLCAKSLQGVLAPKLSMSHIIRVSSKFASGEPVDDLALCLAENRYTFQLETENDQALHLVMIQFLKKACDVSLTLGLEDAVIGEKAFEAGELSNSVTQVGFFIEPSKIKSRKLDLFLDVKSSYPEVPVLAIYVYSACSQNKK